MKSSRIQKAINDIDDDLISEALEYQVKAKTPYSNVLKLALCGFSIILCLGIFNNFFYQDNSNSQGNLGNIMITNPLYDIEIKYNDEVYQVNLINYELNEDYSYYMRISETNGAFSFEDDIFDPSDEIYLSNMHPDELIIHATNFNDNGEAYIKFARINK